MGRSRIAIGISLSDGTPNAMLEAMIMGAFPIQSDTVSTREWIDHGVNGFIIPPEDPRALASAIKKALQDDGLVNRAADMNSNRMYESVDERILRPKIIADYERVVTDSKRMKVNYARASD
jgi:glycosyltransferase involved in cell wall biosynthesis